MKKYTTTILLTLILVGGMLRFTHVNWDSYQAFHPDERNISWAVTRIQFFSQLNPKFFAYGGLPIYLYRAIGEIVVRATHNPLWLADWGHIAVIGRTVSAILSTITIGLIYLVGGTYFSSSVGILAAGLLAFSPWAIREAHFATTETMLVFFLLAIVYKSHVLLTKSTVKLVFSVGIVWGLAIAAKTTSLMFGIIPATALILPILNKEIVTRRGLTMVARQCILAIFLVSTMIVVFFLFSPYTLLDFAHFQESMSYESGVAFGRFTVPYTLQFLHTVPYLYQTITMLWQAGPLVAVGLVGILVLIFSLVRNHSFAFTRMTTIIFLIFPLTYFVFVGHWFAKFNRYNVPFLPFVTLAAAWFMVVMAKKVQHSKFWFSICLCVDLLICVFTICWGVANWTIYLRPQTRITATEWIYQHIPPTAKLYTEHWNDGLPLDLPERENIHYDRELLNVYDEPDNATKAQYYADKLSSGDYVILSTRRIWATMPNLTLRYPVTSMFYKKLFAGELGYTEVASFSSYPQLLGIAVNDDHAEESLQVFDHPTVKIFQNKQQLSREELINRLTP